MGRGVNLWAACVGAAPGARAEKLRAESCAAQYQKRFLFGRAAPPHNTTGDAACDAIELGLSK